VGPRRRGRQLALQALYQRDVAGEFDIPVRALLQLIATSEEVDEFALRLVEGVLANEKEIDEMIAAVSEHWRVERLSKVDRNILRLAVYELLDTPDVPVNVVINEAIEIARRFGAEGSTVFVNGVLDAVAQRIGAKNREQAAGKDG
jgi:N utilization substance protein B